MGYVMGGVGMARTDGTIEKVSFLASTKGHDTVFAYQFGGGFSYALNEATTADIGYRYIGSKDLDFEGLNVSYGIHEVMAGLRFWF